ncbi:MAG: sulfite exporter TauE/SafE family protein [Acidimicrobiia bacterium]|nr:sulfite exporter TauE/SafE family protein [Acidimicrobiia bacterium]
MASDRTLRGWSQRNLRSGVWRWRFAAILKIALLVSLLGAAVLLAVLVFTGTPDDTRYLASGIGVLIGLGAFSFVAEYIDSSVGMGYGTIVAPVLLLGGFEPSTVIPAVLVAEAISGLVAAALHHRARNVDFTPASRDLRVATFIAVPAAAAAAATAAVATTLDLGATEVVIGVIVIAGGAIVLAGRRVSGAFSWSKAGGLGLLAAIAKGVSGGGFGPVSTVGQIAIGIPERSAIGITSLAEGIASCAGLAVFVAIEGWPPLRLAAPLVIGGLLAIPAAVWTVRLLSPSTMRVALGAAACFLGGLVLITRVVA